MDLGGYILDLLSPMRVGDELVAGVQLVASSTELGPRLSFQVGRADLHVDVALAEEGSRYAARSERLMFSYRTGSGQLGVDPQLALKICQTVAERAARNERRVLEALGRAALAERAEEGGARVREVRVTRLLEPAGSPERRYFTLSPYVGCLIGCRFCYAQRRVKESRRLEALPEVPWGSYVDVRVNAPEVLEQELSALEPAPLKFCPIVSDPYQAVEKRYELTQRCLRVIRNAQRVFPTLVLTRSQLLERDLELLQTLPDVRVGVSLPTVDDAARRHFEPRGASVEQRLALLSKLRSAGVRTFAVVQPLLPGDVAALAEALGERVESVSIDVLHGVEGAEREFNDARYAEAREDAWQRARALELRAALESLNVGVWSGELPPDLA